MSSRSSFRRKMVLPVSVVRHGGQEKQLAHTLDATSTSARLGGLVSLLEPGEIIEVMRGGARAKFQVVWMGAPGGAMAGQAGIRGLDPNKCIWNVDLPDDEIDMRVDTGSLRQPMPPVHSAIEFPGERRWHPRYACSGSVAIKTGDSGFAVYGEAKDISEGGIYIELSAPLPVNSTVRLDMTVEGIRFEGAGTVRTSYPLLGMGICLQNLSPESAEKLVTALERAKRNSAKQRELTSAPGDPVERSEAAGASESTLPAAGLQDEPGAELVTACRRLIDDFEHWKQTSSVDEIEELKLVIRELEQKLSFSPQTSQDRFIEYLPAPAQNPKTV